VQLVRLFVETKITKIVEEFWYLVFLFVGDRRQTIGNRRNTSYVYIRSSLILICDVMFKQTDVFFVKLRNKCVSKLCHYI